MSDLSLFPEGYDICANRHGGNSASVEANARVDKDGDRAKVLAIIREKGRTYSKEVARILDKPLNCVSGRLTDLKKMKLIRDTDERAEGCGIVELVPEGSNAN